MIIARFAFGLLNSLGGKCWVWLWANLMGVFVYVCDEKICIGFLVQVDEV